MKDTRRVVLRLEVDVGDEQSISGLVLTQGRHRHPFWGWSEMFAVLRELTVGPDGSAAAEVTGS